MSNTKNKELEVVKQVKKEKSSQSYYFYSVGCGFCKKAEPIVDELIKEGHDILKLDTAEVENRKIADTLKKEYNVQCGTPWFINPETGKGVCGFREKDILEKWLDGEDIPAPPRPNSQMPRPPFLGSTGKEETIHTYLIYNHQLQYFNDLNNNEMDKNHKNHNHLKIQKSLKIRLVN